MTLQRQDAPCVGSNAVCTDFEPKGLSYVYAPQLSVLQRPTHLCAVAPPQHQSRMSPICLWSIVCLSWQATPGHWPLVAEVAGGWPPKLVFIIWQLCYEVNIERVTVNSRDRSAADRAEKGAQLAVAPRAQRVLTR